MLRTRTPSILLLAQATGSVAAGDMVAAAGTSTTQAEGRAVQPAAIEPATGTSTTQAQGAAAGVVAGDIVPAAGTSTTSAVGADANVAAPAAPTAGRARLRGSPTWSGPTLAELAREQDEDELLEIVAALAAAGVLDGVSGLPGARRV